MMLPWLVLVAVVGLVHGQPPIDPRVQAQLDELRQRQQWTEALLQKIAFVFSNFGGNTPSPKYPETTTTTFAYSTSPNRLYTTRAPTLRKKFYESSGVFIVPPGVRSLNVIVIGGGGGGKDGSNSTSRGANGGVSKFAKYMTARGGQAGYGNNKGGAGGRGCTRKGGNGGKGGSCSAGGGAAGQTSKPSDLHPGSSTFPYCGAGGSSAATSCASIFEGMPLGTSGPGGSKPRGRNGAKYGGGGGSRAGGRAGGGGGFCRKDLHVVPEQAVTVIVGKGGHGYSWGRGYDGNGADGVVVVQWQEWTTWT